MTALTDLRQKGIARLYLPLLLNVQLMSVSHTIINGALARQKTPVVDLAAFGVAVALHLFIASIAFQNHTLVLARGGSRSGFRTVCAFSGFLALFVTIVLGLFGYTPVGTWVLKGVLGVTDDVAEGAQSALQILTFLPVFTGARGLAQGLLIRARRTELVSLSTLIRIGALLAGLTAGEFWFSGPQLGAFALWLCIAVEAAFTIGFAFYLPRQWDEATDDVNFLSIARFAAPLCISSGLQLTVPLLVSAMISRLPDGKVALAGFGVIRGFLFLLAGPQRNIQQVFLALVKTVADNRALWRFNLTAGVVLALTMASLAGPLNDWVLGAGLGLSAQMRSTIALPLFFCALFPLGVGIVYQRAGQLTRENRTNQIGLAVGVKILYLLLLWSIFPWIIPWLAWPGALTAILLFLSAQWIEMACLFRSGTSFAPTRTRN